MNEALSFTRRLLQRVEGRTQLQVPKVSDLIGPIGSVSQLFELYNAQVKIQG